jgi:hypothetical protein
MRAQGALLIFLLATMVPRTDAASLCAADCVRRMAECRATQCAGVAQKPCRDRCRAITGCRAGGARIRTLASVVTTCRDVDGMWTGEQRFEIKRGDCAPQTVVHFAAPNAVPSLPGDFNLCRLYGRVRDGVLAMTVGPLQRIGMSPDGQTILFEISTGNVGLPGPAFEVADEGIFAVRADGSHVRRLGPASRARPYKGPIFGYPFPPGFNLVGAPYFHFSPDGRYVVFSDQGPGADGTDAGQLVVMDVESGERTQVTSFSLTTQFPPAGFDVYGFFVDVDTISGGTIRVEADSKTNTGASFLVRRDGSDFRFFVPPSPVVGARVVEDFQVAGRDGNVLTVKKEEQALLPDPDFLSDVWVRDGTRLLQLTNLGRSDTYGGAISRDGGRVFFKASVNLDSDHPTNPMNNCQLFSVSRLGGPLRQLTRFDPPLTSAYGCNRNALPPACRVQNYHVDPVTGSVVFEWNCDPFGLHSISQQIFAMRADGSGLRQVTNYPGLVEAADGSLSVELAGPTVYPARDSSAGRRKAGSP